MISSRALAIGLAAAIVSGCGAQIGATGVPQGVGAQSVAHPATSSSGDLVYVTIGDVVHIFSYPGFSEIKTFKPSAWLGLWGDSNPNNGEMCFDSYGPVYLYGYGATQPLATITPPPSSESFDCAMDQTTNDVAITFNTNSQNWVSVYSNPSENPMTYSDPGMGYVQWAAYDGSGNLFIDGQFSNGYVALLDELPKGGKQLIELQTNPLLVPVGPLHWDGQYMTMTIRDAIYRFQVSGSSVSVVGKTRIKDAPTDADFVIQGNTAIGRASKVGNGQRNGRWLGVWDYPTGGKPFDAIKITKPGKKDIIGAVVVSVGSSGSGIRK